MSNTLQPQDSQSGPSIQIPADTVITEVDNIPAGATFFEGAELSDATNVENLPPVVEEALGLKVPAVATSTTEPEIAALMERVSATHRVKVYQDEEKDYWEVYLIHVSSLPKHSTVVTLRNVMGEGNTYGKHVRIQGTKAEVLEACSKWQ